MKYMHKLRLLLENREFTYHNYLVYLDEENIKREKFGRKIAK